MLTISPKSLHKTPKTINKCSITPSQSKINFSQYKTNYTVIRIWHSLKRVKSSLIWLHCLNRQTMRWKWLCFKFLGALTQVTSIKFCRRVHANSTKSLKVFLWIVKSAWKTNILQWLFWLRNKILKNSFVRTLHSRVLTRTKVTVIKNSRIAIV